MKKSVQNLAVWGIMFFTFINMRYFKMKFNPEELGYVPQDNGLLGDYNFSSPYSIYNFAYSEHETGLLVPDGVKIRNQAKLSDILCFSIANYPFLILSDRFFKLILSLRLSKHQNYPLRVVKRDKIIPYHLFLSKECFAEYINFAHSSFYIKNDETKAEAIVDIKNAEAFWNVSKKTTAPYYLRAYNICLNPAAIVYDLFRLPRGLGVSDYIVSETFVDRVNQAGLTGIRFIPFEET